MSAAFTLAEGRKVLARILGGKLVAEYNRTGRYFDRDGNFVVEWRMFQPGAQQDIAAIVTSAAELSGLGALHNGAIVDMCSRMPCGAEAARVEVNAIDPFRWRRSDGKLGREVK